MKAMIFIILSFLVPTAAFAGGEAVFFDHVPAKAKLLPASSSRALSADPTDSEIGSNRQFEIRLQASSGVSGDHENKDLAAALKEPWNAINSQGIESFLKSHPQSRWAASLWLNLGVEYYKSGYFSRGLGAFRSAWDLAKNDSALEDVANRAASELARMYSQVGDVEQLKAVLEEMKGRRFKGLAAQHYQDAQSALVTMKNDPATSFRCGAMALGSVLRRLQKGRAFEQKIENSRASTKGFSLTQLWNLSEELGMNMQMAQRQPGAAVIVPSVVNWKMGHYAALVKDEQGLLHSEDPAFGDDEWLSHEALDEESSGYFLVPSGSLPQGWNPVSVADGNKIFGKGFVIMPPPPAPPSCKSVHVDTCAVCGGNGGSDGAQLGAGNGAGTTVGMPQFNLDATRVSVELNDTPVGYQPPRGPRVNFSLAYNGRAANPQALPVGWGWSNNWNATINYTISYVGCVALVTNVTAHPRDSGQEDVIFNGACQYSRAIVTATAYKAVVFNCNGTPVTSYLPAAFERDLPSGWKEIYQQDLSAGTSGVIALSQLIDPQGNAVTLGYDGQQRLSSLTDALGQITNFSYDDPAASGRITKVTDPFGRYCALAYDNSGNLSSITDAIGMSSSFGYNDPTNANLATSMTTPYGTTRFDFAMESDGVGRILTVTHPDGQQRMLRFSQLDNYVENPPVPQGILFSGSWNFLQYRDTFYWDEHAMQLAPGDIYNAKIYHWLHSVDTQHQSNMLESTKEPLENRIWLNYPGQLVSIYEEPNMFPMPAKIGRVLSDGSTQLEQNDYNAYGSLTHTVDALGRQMFYDYGSGSQIDPNNNGIDLMRVRDGNGEVLASYTYNSGHKPLTYTDAAGQVTNFSYNSFGELTSVQSPMGETSTLTYDSNGFLTQIQPPQPGSTVTLTYDGANRVATTNDAVNGTLTYSYDNLNRLTQVQYPDGTTQKQTFDKLDVASTTDRLGRTTTMTYDALRHLKSVLDPDNRLTQLSFCGCGSLETLIDPAGNQTAWTYDIQKRLTKKTFSDNTSRSYVYENSTSRLKSVTDAKNQTTNYTYNVDDSLAGISYSNAQNPTASVSFQYESVLGRLSQMVDGTGVTNFNYYPISVGQMGAGRVSSVVNPLPNSDVSYSYDADGRVISRNVHGVGESYGFQANTGQLTQVTSPLGTFEYQYDPSSARLAEIDYPNNSKTNLSYFDPSGSGRLSEIKSQAGTATLLDFQYQYDAAGQIATWTQGLGSNPLQAYTLTNDDAGQLTSGILKKVSDNSVLANNQYIYDKAGNRISSSTNGVYYAATANNLNQLTGITNNAATYVHGTASHQPAQVTVANVNATVNQDKTFSTYIYLAPGANTVPVTATDLAGNVKTSNFSMNAGQTFTYDANGNLTSDGNFHYDWDAADRLIQISTQNPSPSNPPISTKFTYDGMWRRERMLEKHGVTTVADRRFVWDGTDIAEERDASNATVKRFYGMGVQQVSGTQAGNYYYQRDHLGSVRDVLDATGAVIASYDYDLWGNRTQTAGTFVADFGYAGYFEHQPSGLALTQYRAYSPLTGRWISRDPMGERGGMNLYGYVDDHPLLSRDPLGLLDLFGFGSLGGDTPTPLLRGAAEGIALAGYNSNNGFFMGNIFAAGCEVGSKSNYLAHFEGVEALKGGGSPTRISLTELNLGLEIPFLAGVGLGGGYYSSGDENGAFLYAHGGVIGGHGALGIGIGGLPPASPVVDVLNNPTAQAIVPCGCSK